MSPDLARLFIRLEKAHHLTAAQQQAVFTAYSQLGVEYNDVVTGKVDFADYWRSVEQAVACKQQELSALLHAGRTACERPAG